MLPIYFFNVWGCESLGIEEDEYPTTFVFFSEDKFVAAQREGKDCLIIGKRKPCILSNKEGYLLFLGGVVCSVSKESVTTVGRNGSSPLS